MDDMKTLIAGIVLIVVLGVGGFFYRNVLEHPGAPVVSGTACTADAKLCPDGTAVGRTGPNCEFAACAAPNVSLDSIKIAFALPEGYAEPAVAEGNGSPVALYAKGSSDSPNIISIYDYAITGSSTADAVITANTTFEPSDMPATDMKKFSPKIIGTKTFSEVTTERFEGTVTTHYFLARQKDVLDFEITENGITNWTDANLITDNLPEHQALIKMLGTLEDETPQPE